MTCSCYPSFYSSDSRETFSQEVNKFFADSREDAKLIKKSKKTNEKSSAQRPSSPMSKIQYKINVSFWSFACMKFTAPRSYVPISVPSSRSYSRREEKKDNHAAALVLLGLAGTVVTLVGAYFIGRNFSIFMDANQGLKDIQDWAESRVKGQWKVEVRNCSQSHLEKIEEIAQLRENVYKTYRARALVDLSIATVVTGGGLIALAGAAAALAFTAPVWGGAAAIVGGAAVILGGATALLKWGYTSRSKSLERTAQKIINLIDGLERVQPKDKQKKPSYLGQDVSLGCDKCSQDKHVPPYIPQGVYPSYSFPQAEISGAYYGAPQRPSYPPFGVPSYSAYFPQQGH